MIRAAFITSLVFAQALFAGTGSCIELLTPPGHISTTVDHLHIVGRSEAPDVEISLNEEPILIVPVKDGVFHALIWMPYGLNEILVCPIGADDIRSSESCDGSRRIEVLCGPRITRKFQKIYTPYTFHGPDVPGACLNCHAWWGGGSVEGGEAEWCFTCHGVIRDRFRSHIPQDERSCVSCHRVAPDLQMTSTGVYTDMNPCFLCHQDKIGEFAQDFIHGPVAGGTCTVCHDPHGSQFEQILISPVPVLCLFCHTSVEEQDKAVMHQPFREGRCVDCHDPHATSNRWVLVKNSQALCDNCHGEAGHLADHAHPYNVKPKQRRKRYPFRLTESGELECLSCHKAHAGDTVHMLRTDRADTCLGCHPELE